MNLSGPASFSVTRTAWRAIVATCGTALACATITFGQSTSIATPETAFAPTVSRLAAIHAAAQTDGWEKQVPMLRAAALAAYDSEKLAAAEAWFHLFHWAALFGQKSVSEFGPTWIEAVNRARVGHANMPKSMALEDRPMGAALSPALQSWLIGNPAFADEFFSLVDPVDFLPEVFRVLNDLHRADAARFKTYASLAIAIALVYDVAPPPYWPHGQVSETTLPRKFPAPLEAFTWWIRQDQQGKTYHRLTKLGAEELRFVVDAAAPFAELEWAQTAAAPPLNELPRAYSMIRYRQDRAAMGVAVWPGPSYALKAILAAGGICSDQAYFATQVGKARGVPTLLFYGPGNDGRHAWFGFLDGNQKWQLDAGRYAEQRYVTGFARDPQTWAEFSDHDLQFLSERFRNLPTYRQSRTHAAFAAEFLSAGDAAGAVVAARKAVNYERRNRVAWEILIAATESHTQNPKRVEAALHEAAMAFQRYPELEAHYVNRASDSLRARGETSAAEAALRRIARKHEHGRVDLTVQQARMLVQRAIQTQPLPEQMRTYNSTLDSLGRGAGIGFYDQVVAMFVAHLAKSGQRTEALRALERARRTLKVEANSQLAADMRAMEHELKAMK